MILGKSTFFRRGFTLSALSYLGYEVYSLFSQSAVAHASIKVEDIIEQADYLYGSGETEKLYQLLAQHKSSEDAELLWRLARASRDLAQLSSTSEEEKKKLVYEALDYAKKALEKNSSNFAVHKWYAICISDVGDYEGIKTKISNAFLIKEHFQLANGLAVEPGSTVTQAQEGKKFICLLAANGGTTQQEEYAEHMRERNSLKKAIELNPNDATSIHLMGIWCYTFAEMPWYQSRIASLLFTTPPSSTYEKALHYFHMAEKAEPNFYSKNLLFLGKTYMKLGNRKMALLWLMKAKDYPAHTEEDKQVQREAVELLNSV